MPFIEFLAPAIVGLMNKISTQFVPTLTPPHPVEDHSVAPMSSSVDFFLGTHLRAFPSLTCATSCFIHTEPVVSFSHGLSYCRVQRHVGKGVGEEEKMDLRRELGE